MIQFYLQLEDNTEIGEGLTDIVPREGEIVSGYDKTIKITKVLYELGVTKQDKNFMVTIDYVVLIGKEQEEY